MGRPIASNASVCPPAKHVRIVTKMHAVFPALGVVLVVFCRFLASGHHRARGWLTCTRLKKMRANACIKIGCHAPRAGKDVTLIFFFLLRPLRGERPEIRNGRSIPSHPVNLHPSTFILTYPVRN